MFVKIRQPTLAAPRLRRGVDPVATMLALVKLARKTMPQEIRSVRDVFMRAFRVAFGVRVWIHSQNGSTQLDAIIGLDKPLLDLLLVLSPMGAAHFVALGPPIANQIYQPLHCKDGFYEGHVHCHGEMRRVNDQGQYPWGRDDHYLAAFAKVHGLRQAKPDNTCAFNHLAILLLECRLVHPMTFLRGYALHRGDCTEV